MITICELQCRGISHETVNSGFIDGLRRAFPDKRFKIYAHHSHIRALRENLSRHRIPDKSLSYISIPVPKSPDTIHGMIITYFQIRKIFSAVYKSGENQVFFLSHSRLIELIVKRQRVKTPFKSIKCAFVLHSEFESIGGSTYSPQPEHALASALLMKMPLKQIVRKFFAKFINNPLSGPIFVIKGLYHFLNRLILGRISLTQTLLKNPSSNNHYILLSPHIRGNAKEFIDVNRIVFKEVVLPTIFVKKAHYLIRNADGIKLATFGYGNGILMQKLAKFLSEHPPKSQFEIRIIGMDGRGSELNPNISWPIKGRPLNREEMEYYFQDIDLQIILYEKSRYRLSCSGSILEALSYRKPIIYLDNECINAFNQEKYPIGFCCKDMCELALKVQHIVDNRDKYLHEFEIFKRNIDVLRERYSIESQVQNFKASFTF